MPSTFKNLDEENKDEETQKDQDLALTKKSQVEVENDFSQDDSTEIKFTRDTIVEELGQTLRTENLVEQNIKIEPLQQHLNDSNQLDSSLIYTKERLAGADQDLDDDDKELLLDQTEQFVESKPKMDHLEEQAPEIVASQIEDVVIPAENLIIF